MAPGAVGFREMHQVVPSEAVAGSPGGASSCFRCLAAAAGEASSSSDATASTSRPVAALRALRLGGMGGAAGGRAGVGRLRCEWLTEGVSDAKMMDCAVVAVLVSWIDEGLYQRPIDARCQSVTWDWVSRLGWEVARLPPQRGQPRLAGCARVTWLVPSSASRALS